MPEPMIRFSVTIPRALMEEFNAVLRDMGYGSRSKAVRDAIRNLITSYKSTSDRGGECLGAILYIFDHHSADAVRETIELQHRYTDIIFSTLHFHVGKTECLELLTVRGQGQRIRELAKALATLRNVTQLKIVFVS